MVQCAIEHGVLGTDGGVCSNAGGTIKVIALLK